MISRRGFARTLAWSAASMPALEESAFAQRALAGGRPPAGAVLLNANENPDGPPESSIEAMRQMLPHSWRYHYPEFGQFYQTVARSEGLEPGQVLVGAGSSEILHCAMDVFTSSGRPLIFVQPTFETPMVLARALGRPAIAVPHTASYAADVKRMAAEADKAGGGLLYLCNPNNPTSAITPKADVEWLVNHLPPNTVLLLDEAYIHYSADPELESGLRYVRQGRDVVVARTFSKIYGMAGLRAGFGCARPDLIERMAPFRNNVISIVTARAVAAALAEASKLVPERRARLERLRAGLCGWLDEREVRYIRPHANFLMIDIGRDVRSFLPAMYARGVVPGRPFPPLDRMMRVSIGTAADMEKFRSAFWEVYKG